MSNESKPEMYRKFIDFLVDMCHNGQGQIGAKRVVKGVWNQNATSDYIPEQHEVNLLLERLSISERKVIANLLCDQVVTGVFETLKALETFQISPFESGYEGSPFNDFIGRLDDWEWPVSQSK
jgi:hypothetical protein